MNIATEILSDTVSSSTQIYLPYGLIGLPELTRFEITPITNSWPFQSMKAIGSEPINFVVIDPTGLIPDYQLEISDEDVAALQIENSEDAQVLTIATVHTARPQFVTVNLAGPLLVNRRTLLAKQVILANCEQYSTVHPLIDEQAVTFAA